MTESASILLIGDDPATTELVRSTLQPHGNGAVITELANREDVIRALEANQNDLIITDASWSDHTGLEVIEWVRELGLDVPIIMLTGTGTDDIAIEAIRRGVSDYVVKSEEYIKRLPHTVEYVLERARLQRFNRLAEKRLKISEQRYQDLYDNTPDIYLTISEDGTVHSINRFGAAYLGYERDELAHFPLWNVIHADDLALVQEQIRDIFVRDIKTSSLEFRILRRDESVIWVQERATLTTSRYNDRTELQIVCRDITAQKNLEEQLKFDAFHDALTGLPNRALFLDRVQRSLGRSSRHKDYLFAVLFLDLDRFKIINDSLGHGAGDELLVTIAHRMKKYLRTGDSIARLGGDEFCILLDDLRYISDATRFAERIQDEIGKSVRLGDTDITISASIGIAASTSGYRSPYAVLRDADTAMYRAKELGKARFAMFDKSMHSEVVQRLALEQELRVAIKEQQFEVFYQPVISLGSGKITGCEALLRWRHPVNGLLKPAAFLDVLEDTGGTIPVGKWMIDQICRQACLWQEKFESGRPMSYSINLSSRQLVQPDLAAYFDEAIHASEIEHCSLHLEMTEDMIMRNAESVTAMLLKLGKHAVRLSIDNFGQGYSSVSLLHQMPISHLKVGRDLVMGAEPGSRQIHIVKTIIVLARELGVDVVAVGIESADQLSLFREIGCEYAQGHLIAEPLGAEAFENLVASGRQW